MPDIVINPQRLTSDMSLGQKREKDLSLLITRMLEGDLEARNDFLAAMYDKVHRKARSRLKGPGFQRLRDGGKDKSKSIVHEMYAKFLNCKYDLKTISVGRFIALCGRVLDSTIKDLYRKELVKRKHIATPISPKAENDVSNTDPIEDWADAERRFKQYEEQVGWSDAVGRLSEKQRAIVYMHMTLEMSLKDIQRVLEPPVSYDTVNNVARSM